ncbi:hypothetical protein [Methylobacterium sp. NEAU K]|uniref:hypothetical protein n=1 Tax=Methylobacterium sp. NEAU K TaxID=3064946 RepID=UPI0027365885|nr:hypothetical protein [Methylobacterium sp. NEAU K]MDP4005186.1 hypothetical protein [Methylobacterium sp. NEAU K]
MNPFTLVPKLQALPDRATRKRLATRHGTALRRLARELNVPTETFSGEPPAGEAGELLALMRHWLAIEDGQSRRRILSLARQEAERSGYSECA